MAKNKKKQKAAAARPTAAPAPVQTAKEKGKKKAPAPDPARGLVRDPARGESREGLELNSEVGASTGINLYEIFGLDRFSSMEDIKMAFYTLDLAKKQMDQKIRELHCALSIIGNRHKKIVSDQTGWSDAEVLQGISRESCQIFFKGMSVGISEAEVIAHRGRFMGSDEESDALIKLYKLFEGNIERVMDMMICADGDADVKRFKYIIQDAVDRGELSPSGSGTLPSITISDLVNTSSPVICTNMFEAFLGKDFKCNTTICVGKRVIDGYNADLELEILAATAKTDVKDFPCLVEILIAGDKSVNCWMQIRRCAHQNILRLIGVARRNATLAFVYDDDIHCSLRTYLDHKKGYLCTQRTPGMIVNFTILGLRMMWGIVNGVHEAQKCGCFVRLLTLDNIFVTKDGRIKLSLTGMTYIGCGTEESLKKDLGTIANVFEEIIDICNPLDTDHKYWIIGMTDLVNLIRSGGYKTVLEIFRNPLLMHSSSQINFVKRFVDSHTVYSEKSVNSEYFPDQTRSKRVSLYFKEPLSLLPESERLKYQKRNMNTYEGFGSYSRCQLTHFDDMHSKMEKFQYWFGGTQETALRKLLAYHPTFLREIMEYAHRLGLFISFTSQSPTAPNTFPARTCTLT